MVIILSTLNMYSSLNIIYNSVNQVRGLFFSVTVLGFLLKIIPLYYFHNVWTKLSYLGFLFSLEFQMASAFFFFSYWLKNNFLFILSSSFFIPSVMLARLPLQLFFKKRKINTCCWINKWEISQNDKLASASSFLYVPDLLPLSRGAFHFVIHNLIIHLC